jgi:hypothetical protein
MGGCECNEIWKEELAGQGFRSWELDIGQKARRLLERSP